MGAVRVLSLRGGGIRGIVPAVILANLERVTRRSCRELFDLIVGTSTGGILALALAQGIPAEQIVHMYQERGPEIFRRRWRHRFGLLGAKYDIGTLRRVLADTFGSATLGDGTRAMVTATLVATRRAEFIKSWKGGKSVSVVDAASATSAAPTYFDPVDVVGIGLLMDGGLHSNNPALAALTETQKLYPGAIPRIVDIACSAPRFVAPGGSGAIQWAGSIVDTLIDAGEDVAAYHVARAIERAGDGGGYLEIIPALTSASDAMDDASERNIRALIADASIQMGHETRRIQEHIA